MLKYINILKNLAFKGNFNNFFTHYNVSTERLKFFPKINLSI